MSGFTIHHTRLQFKLLAEESSTNTRAMLSARRALNIGGHVMVKFARAVWFHLRPKISITRLKFSARGWVLIFGSASWRNFARYVKCATSLLKNFIWEISFFRVAVFSSFIFETQHKCHRLYEDKFPFTRSRVPSKRVL